MVGVFNALLSFFQHLFYIVPVILLYSTLRTAVSAVCQMGGGVPIIVLTAPTTETGNTSPENYLATALQSASPLLPLAHEHGFRYMVALGPQFTLAGSRFCSKCLASIQVEPNCILPGRP